jgi:hypothetical protein
VLGWSAVIYVVAHLVRLSPEDAAEHIEASRAESEVEEAELGVAH